MLGAGVAERWAYHFRGLWRNSWFFFFLFLPLPSDFHSLPLLLPCRLLVVVECHSGQTSTPLHSSDRYQANAGTILGHREKNRSWASPQPSGAKAAGKGHKPANRVRWLAYVFIQRELTSHRGVHSESCVIPGWERLRLPRASRALGYIGCLLSPSQEKAMARLHVYFCDWSLFPLVSNTDV